MQKLLKDRDNASVDFNRDTESAIQNPNNYPDLARAIEERLTVIKGKLEKSDEDQNDSVSDNYALLLHGYISLEKVVRRLKPMEMDSND